MVIQERAHDECLANDQNSRAQQLVCQVEESYTKVSLWADTTWWDHNNHDAYRMANLGLWAAVVGCNSCQWHQFNPGHQVLPSCDQNDITIVDDCLPESSNAESRGWLSTNCWPSTLLHIYPQIPNTVVSDSNSLFSHIHSAGSEGRNMNVKSVKELILYNRLTQHSVKNLWNENSAFTSKSFQADLSWPEQRISIKPLIAKNEKFEVTETSLLSKENKGRYEEAKVTKYRLDFKDPINNKELTLFEYSKANKSFGKKEEHKNLLQNSIVSPLLNSTVKDKLECSLGNEIRTNSLQTNSQRIQAKSRRRLSKQDDYWLIRDNFGSFPFSCEGDLMETMEDVCRWLNNVYPRRTGEFISLSTVAEQLESLTRQLSGQHFCINLPILPGGPQCGVIQPSEVVEEDSGKKFAELEREALEQYSSSGLESDTSLAVLQTYEETKFKDLEREAIEQYQAEESSNEQLSSYEFFINPKESSVPSKFTNPSTSRENANIPETSSKLTPVIHEEEAEPELTVASETHNSVQPDSSESTYKEACHETPQNENTKEECTLLEGEERELHKAEESSSQQQSKRKKKKKKRKRKQKCCGRREGGGGSGGGRGGNGGRRDARTPNHGLPTPTARHAPQEGTSKRDERGKKNSVNTKSMKKLFLPRQEYYTSKECTERQPNMNLVKQMNVITTYNSIQVINFINQSDQALLMNSLYYRFQEKVSDKK